MSRGISLVEGANLLSNVLQSKGLKIRRFEMCALVRRAHGAHS